MEKMQNDNTEQLAEAIPLTTWEKWRIVLIIAVILIVCGLIAAGVIIGLQVTKLKKTADIALATIDAHNTSFNVIVTRDNKVTSMEGSFHYTPEKTRAKCEVDYGNRAVQLYVDTDKDDAYMYIESETDEYYIHTDISIIRLVLGTKTDSVEWEDFLKSLSSESVNLTDFYDPSKIDTAIENTKKRLLSPFELTNLLNVRRSGGAYIITTDGYKLMTFMAKSLKDVYVSENSYKNLQNLIKEEKKALQAQTVTVRIYEKDGKVDSITVDVGGENPVSVDITFTKTGTTEPQKEYTADPERCETVSLNTAYRLILRAGLDTEAAQKEANMSLNAFAERYNYNIKVGTVVIVTDKDGNDFRFVYTSKYKLEETEPGDEAYDAWEKGGYVQLGTEGMDTGAYTVEMYEPASVKNDSADYNNAYLAALQTVYSVTSARYEIPNGAILLVKENGTDFQFRYEGGNLYDVYEQYYYMIYVDGTYSPANLTAINDIPDNVVLYMPNEQIPDTGASETAES